MGAQASSAVGALDRLKGAAYPGSSTSKRTWNAPTSPNSRRFYDESVRLSNYAGRALVARDRTAVFLDWDDTLFPSSWVQVQQRICKEAGRPCLLRDDPTVQLLCKDIITFLCTVSRLGHVFIVTASTYGFVTKCCRVCFPELLQAFDELNVSILYARPQFWEADNEPVEMWKHTAYRTLLGGRFIRPLMPALARFHDAPVWSHVLSYGDSWSDHTTLKSAIEVVSPESVHMALKACPAKLALSAEALSNELIMAGGLLRHFDAFEVDCSYDLEDPQVRRLVQDLTSSNSYPAAIEAIVGLTPVVPATDLKSNLSSVSTAAPTTVRDASSPASTQCQEPSRTPTGRVFFAPDFRDAALSTATA
jgi:hypothetical protein